MTDKKCITITNAFKKTSDNSICKADKIWVDKVTDFYRRLMK